MMKMILQAAATIGVVTLCATSALAVTVPFTESFDADVAGWTDNAGNAASFVGSGGADGGGFASVVFDYTTFSSPFGGGPVVLRGNGANNPSGGAFIGDYIADGVAALTVNVRHDSAVPLSFSTRLAPASNTPGTNLIEFAPVPGGAWTQLTFEVVTTPGLCVFERPGGCTLAGFQDVFNVQLGTDAPAGAGLVTLDFDLISLVPVPEPGTALLMGLGLAGLAISGREASPKG